MVETRRTEFIGEPTEVQRLATETCPYFDDAVRRALGDYWEVKECPNRGCLVAVKFIPPISELRVKGSCPML